MAAAAPPAGAADKICGNCRAEIKTATVQTLAELKKELVDEFDTNPALPDAALPYWTMFCDT